MPFFPAMPEPVTAETAIDPAIVQCAAVWMARLWSGEASDEDQAACKRWRTAHPDHERAWQGMQLFEQKLGGVPREMAHQALREPARKSIPRRRALQLLATALAVGALGWRVRESQVWLVASAEERSATGDIRELFLSDGTRVVMASASAIDIRFDASERRIVLRAGEIMVDTAPDPAARYRPLRLQSRHGTVQALGTRFMVREHADVSQVAVFEGAVDVRPNGSGGRATRIAAGQGTQFSAEQAASPQPVPQSAAAWTRGVLVATDMPLGELLAEIGRYRQGFLRCAPEIAHLTVTGVFSLRDTDRALHNLTLGMPLKIVYRTRYWVSVVPL